MAALNREVKQPLALVQLGIAAPALVTAYINGENPSSVARTAYENLSVISSAKAEETTSKPFRLAGGLLGDITKNVIPGLGTRLDTLNEANRSNIRQQAAPNYPNTIGPVNPQFQ